MRLAARGARMSVQDFVRAAVLRAACDVRSRQDCPVDLDRHLATLEEDRCVTPSRDPSPDADLEPRIIAPGEAEQIVATLQWDVDWKFHRPAAHTHALWVQPEPSERGPLREFQRTLGAVVHGRLPSEAIGRNAYDWLREHAWRIEANRTDRPTGLVRVPIPDGGARIDDGVLILAVGSLSVKITLGKKNRNAHPGHVVLRDALLEPVGGGKWKVRYSIDPAQPNAMGIKKARPTKKVDRAE